jgi:transcriptional regulator with XRE-family HTH domain
MSWSTSKALLDVFRIKKISQTVAADRLAVSQSHISLLLSGKNKPSRMLLKLASLEFGINLDWLEKGEGEPFDNSKLKEEYSKYKYRENMKKRIMVSAAILVPLLPAASAGLAIGVGVEEALDFLKRTYGAKTMSELAGRYLNTDVSSLSRWKAKGRIPDKVLKKVCEDKQVPIEQILLDGRLIELGRKEIIEFVKNYINKDREEGICIDDIEDDFNKEFPLAAIS